MTEEETRQVESSQRKHHEVLEHQDRAFLTVEKIEYNLFQILKPKLYKDGDKWCVLYGDDIQEGICGFGETPYKAILDWNKQWNSKI